MSIKSYSTIFTSVNLFCAVLFCVVSLCGCASPERGTISFEETDNHSRTSTATGFDRCMRAAAVGYRNGDYQVVESSFQKAIDESKGFDAKDPRRPLAMRSLATAYQEQGKYAQAQPLFEGVLELDKKILGAEHADIARDLNLLAVNYQTQENFLKAEPLLQQAVEILEKLATGKAEEAAAHADLARNLIVQKKFAAAQPHLLKAIAIDEKIYGKEHIKVAEDLISLAEAYQKQKKIADADACFKRALAIQEKLLGAKNPQFVQTKKKYAELLGAGQKSESGR